MSWRAAALALALLGVGGCASTQAAGAQAPVHAAPVEIGSSLPFAATVEAIQQALQAKGLRVFAVIDHAAAAREAGMAMRPATVVLFGRPQAGTPLMQADPALALDLPLRVLVAEDASGRVTVSWHRSSTLAAIHGLPPERLAPLDAAEPLLRAAVQARP